MVSFPVPGLDYSNVLQFIEATWKSVANCVHEFYQTGIEFVRNMPHFNKFDQDDQISLIECKHKKETCKSKPQIFSEKMGKAHLGYLE